MLAVKLVSELFVAATRFQVNKSCNGDVTVTSSYFHYSIATFRENLLSEFQKKSVKHGAEYTYSKIYFIYLFILFYYENRTRGT